MNDISSINMNDMNVKTFFLYPTFLRLNDVEF